MCGIAGIFHCETPKPVDPGRVSRMCEALAHRGPDGAGVWTAPGVAIGHRGLAFVDRAGTSAPVESADGKAVLSLDGEIYNSRELRRELTKLGAKFRTKGEMEVVLAAWRQWGVDCLPRLDGMFAMAIYDSERRMLFLARDRLGVKPLFTAHLSDGSLAFASELRGLMAHPLLRREIDPLAIEDYLAWGFVPDHRSILKGVEKLPAGHYRVLRTGMPSSPPIAWWNLSFADRRPGREGDLEAEMLHLLRDAVTGCMGTSAPLGALVEDDLGSASMLALMAEASRKPVQAFTTGLEAGDIDRSSLTGRMATRFRAEHRTRANGGNDFEELDWISSAYGEPFAHAAALRSWRTCQLARERVSVALSAVGVDEALAGLRRQMSHARKEAIRRLVPAAVRSTVLSALGRLYPRSGRSGPAMQASSALDSLGQGGEAAYARSLSFVSSDVRQGLYTPDFLKDRGDYRAEQPLIELMRNAPARSALDRAQYADLKFGLPADTLTRMDRASMSVGLELRQPLLDHRIVQFGASLPERMRIRGQQGTWMLKQTMARYLPRDLVPGNARGSPSLVRQWLQGPLASAVRSIPASASLGRTGWFDSRRLAFLAEEHLSGQADHARLLWQLLVLDRSLARQNVI